VLRVTRVVVGSFLAIIGASTTIAMVSGSHIESSRYVVAWAHWRQSPTPANEAAWLREKHRVERLELFIAAGGVCVLAAGAYLALGTARFKS
jgi:hypothetical protein